MSSENKFERVIVITGGADNGAEIARMLAGKVSAHNYEVLTRDDAIGRGLMLDDIADRFAEPVRPRQLGARIKEHAERAAWNAAVDAKKAARRGRKAAP